jgi:hypothetical protein
MGKVHGDGPQGGLIYSSTHLPIYCFYGRIYAFTHIPIYFFALCAPRSAIVPHAPRPMLSAVAHLSKDRK